jgi:hypothetical protein
MQPSDEPMVKVLEDSPRGPLNNWGKPTSSRKNTKRKLIHEPKRKH